MYRGFVKVWRKIEDEPWYKKPFTCLLAQHLLRKACHKDCDIVWNKEIVHVKRGQIITGRQKLIEETGLTDRSSRTALQNLKKSGFLSSKTSNRYSILTICNYDKYQFNSNNNVQQTVQQGVQQTVQQGVHIQEDKNIKKIKNNNIYVEDAQKVLDYLNQKRNKHFSKKDEIIARLKEGHTVEECIKIIDNKLEDPHFIENPKFLNPVTLFRYSHFDVYMNEEHENKVERLERLAKERGLL